MTVLLAAVVGAAAAGLLLFISWLVAPRRPSELKGMTYECGIRPVGQHWSQFHVRYYIFAILFLIFDVEAVFLFPWAMVFLGLKGVPAVFYEMLIFIGILLFGLAYAWKKGVLKWD